MTLDCGNCGMFLIMGNAGYLSSTVCTLLRNSLDSIPALTGKLRSHEPHLYLQLRCLSKNQANLSRMRVDKGLA